MEYSNNTRYAINCGANQFELRQNENKNQRPI